MSQRPRCPVCGEIAVPIVYGFPTREMSDAADRGEIALGGCEAFGEYPRWECSGCRWQWREPEALAE